MLDRIFSRATWWGFVGFVMVGLIAASNAWSQTFVPTSGTADWNDDNNWSPMTYPNSSGAAATIPEATDDLTVNLNESITIGSLDILKPASGAAVTTISEGTSGSLTFSGGTATLTNSTSAAGGTGATVIDAPIAFTGGLTVTQYDDTSFAANEGHFRHGRLEYHARRRWRRHSSF